MRVPSTALLDPAGFGIAVAEAARSVLARPLPVVQATLAAAAGADHPATELPPSRGPWFALVRHQHVLLAGQLLAATRAVVEDPQVSDPSRRKLEFLAHQVVAATEPDNWPWSNPAVLQRAIDTRGASLVRGLRNAVRDVATNGGMPLQTPPGRFVVGRDVAATTGSVVLRNRLIEVIQYAPQTELVHEVPLLVSPPWINKYYVMDLAPGRSLVEWAVRRGHAVFAISYRNPDPDEDAALGELSLSDYLREGLLGALDVVTGITGARCVNVVGLCLGGTLAACAAAWHAARGERRIRSLTLVNTLLDFTDPGPLAAFTDAAAVDRIERDVRAAGHVPAASMKAVFDLLRPAELLWSYVISGWWLGEEPPAFDVLAWNADATRMPAAMQIEYLRSCYVENRLAAGELELAGERLDLGSVRQDAYVVGAEADHITPWESVLRSARLLGGPVRFVLSTSGHVGALVNPPSDRTGRRRFRAAGPGPLSKDATSWRAGAVERAGSWWPDWAEWLAERAGALRPPPPTGTAAHPPLGPAPGRYVLAG